MNILQRLSNLLKRDRPSSERTWLSPRQAGVHVNEDTALTHAAVWACVRIIAETLGALPWRAHQRTVAGSEIQDGTLDYLLHVEANPDTAAQTWRETLVAHALLWGNGYAEIERDMRGEAWNLWQIAPDKLKADRTADGRLWYIQDGAPVLEARNVFHLRGLGFDGLTGYSPIRLAARSIGVGVALDTMAASTFANGAAPSLAIVQKEGKALSAEAVQNMLKVWEIRFQGPANGHKVGYLDAGMEIQQLGMPMDDLQFLESRKFQVSEVARWFRVPPHKLADLERATFSNIEHQALEFVSDTLVPWVRRLETEAQVKLIGRNNRAGRVYTKINMAGLLRGDLASRYQAYATGRQWGWLSANDVRELEDLNRIPGGDDYLAPVNMVPADLLRDESEARRSQAAEPDPAASEAQEAAQAEVQNLLRNLERPNVVNVAPAPPPVVNVAAPEVTIHLPEQTHQIDVAAPVVNVAPAEVTIQPQDIHVAAPAITVENRVEPTPVSIVNELPPPEVTVNLPARRTETTIERDRAGNIVRAEQLETDA